MRTGRKTEEGRPGLLDFVREGWGEGLRRWKGWLFLAGFGAALWVAGDRLLLSGMDPEVLRFAHPFTTASERAILDAAVAEFERTHPPLKVEQVVFNSDTYQTIAWRLQFRGRKQPDVYFHWQGYKVDHAIRKGWALDLEPLLRKGFLEEFVPAGIERRQGGIFHLPQSVDLSNLVWFNQSLFREKGLEEPRELEQWLEACEKLREGGVLPLAQGNRDLWPMGNLGAEFLGKELGADGLRRLFLPETVVRAEDLRGLDVFARLRERGAFEMPGVLARGAVGSMTDIDAKVLFLSGRAGQHIVGSWLQADVQDAKNRGELGFAPGVSLAPAPLGRPNVVASVTTGYLVNPASRNKKAAAAFLELLLSRKYQSEFAKLGNLSLRRDAAEFTVDPLAKKLLELLGRIPAIVPPPDTGYAPEQAAIFYELCARLVMGEFTLAEAAEYWNREKADLGRKRL